MHNKDRQLLGFLAIALAAVFAIYLSAIPQGSDYVADDSLLSDLANISPAAGDVVPGGVGGSATDSAASAVPQEPEDLEKDKAYSVMQIFDSEDACKEATSRACHLVKCAGDALPPAAEDVTETTVENACGENEKTGWRPVVPAPDKTSIPEVISPPAALTTE